MRLPRFLPQLCAMKESTSRPCYCSTKPSIMVTHGPSLVPLQAEGFYAEHKGRPFFAGLVEFMTSGPVTMLILQKK